MKVSDAMSSPVVSVKLTTTLKEALDLLKDKSFNHLPIADATGKLLGIVSDRDLKRLSSPFAGSAVESAKDQATLKIPVEKIMKSEPITCAATDTLKSVVEIMLQKHIHALPVVEAETGLLKGMISTSDILRSFLKTL